MEVQDLISNGEGKNEAELMYRDDRENNRMEDVHVFSSTETDTIKRECIDTSASEKSSRKHALVKSKIVKPSKPDIITSVEMEDSAIAEESEIISTNCFSPRTSDFQKRDKVMISNSKRKEKVERLQQLPIFKLAVEKENESRETDSSESGKANNTEANSSAYVCIFCDSRMRNLDELLQHVNSHVGKRMKCKICHKECNTSEDLRQHAQSHQNEKGIVLKAIVSSSQLKLTEHKKIVSNNNPTEQMLPVPAASCGTLTIYSCAGCNLLFKSKTDLIFHKENNCKRNVGEESSTSHSAEAQFPHICKTCGKGFIDKRSLTSHMSCHLKEKPYNCEDCGKSFGSKGNLTKHKRRHMGRKNNLVQETAKGKDALTTNSKKDNTKLRHKCKTCGKGFILKHNLTAHKSRHLKEKPNSCEVCGKSFSSRGNLMKHKRKLVCKKIKITKKDKAKLPHICITCGQSFTGKRSLASHMSSHLEDNTHICEDCGKSFKSRRNLMTHKRKQLNRSFLCDLCGASFNNSDSFYGHKSRHHNKKPPQPCSACGKVFKNGAAVRSHFILRHLKPEDVATCGYRVYPCKVCQKLFSEKRGLRVHMNSHTGLQ